MRHRLGRRPLVPALLASAFLLPGPVLGSDGGGAPKREQAAEPAGPVEPAGSAWLVAGSRPQDYEAELEPEEGRDGTLAASLRSRGSGSPPEGFVTLMRFFGASPYRGRRIRLSAWVKAESVEGWSGLWMRVDDRDPKRTLAFDNMEARAIRGTSDWRRYAVVLDVAPEADRVSYGIILSGKGKVWVDDFEIEAVGPEVPVTDTLAPVHGPRNLDFDHPPEPPP